MHDGLRVALVGAPNVGKSSVLNALAGREAAIVTEIPGTTRDILEVRLDLDGRPVVLLDTAGMRTTADPIEAEGVRRAVRAAESADLVVDVRDARAYAAADADRDAGRLVFWNKADLLGAPLPDGVTSGSAIAAGGLAQLEKALTRAAQEAMDGLARPAITRARHRAALRDADAALTRALSVGIPELMAEDLRSANRALGRVVGIYDIDDVLDRIFSAFCIGK